jgi:hypothetical protein
MPGEILPWSYFFTTSFHIFHQFHSSPFFSSIYFEGDKKSSSFTFQIKLRNEKNKKFITSNNCGLLGEENINSPSCSLRKQIRAAGERGIMAAVVSGAPTQ